MSPPLTAAATRALEPRPGDDRADTSPPTVHRRPDAPLLAALLSGIATVVTGAAGIALGIVAITTPIGPVSVSWALPLAGLQFEVDALGGIFLTMIGAVAVAVGVYAVGYARREHLPRTAMLFLPVFVASLMLVPASGSATTFLFAWELMAVVSLLLVLTGHHGRAVRTAGVYYAILTQIGFAALLFGLLLLQAAAAGDSFQDMTAGIDRVSPAMRNIVFVATLMGFGSKAGLLPLHAWLPRAHPEAPTPVSALMSSAMVALGVYGLLRFDVQILGPGPQWWGFTLLVVGAVSAGYGILHACVAGDLKRLLAFSTVENMGLVVLSIGAALVLQAASSPGSATLAMTAAVLHVLAHAAFKTLAFLGAGSVLAGTGLRDLDRLGGLARRMPATSLLFGIGALGAAGLPMGAGFVSEWLLLQALIHAPRTDAAVALAMPLTVGVLALTTGLAVATMVKAFGVGCLARPRSTEAENARDADGFMLTGMSLAAAGCVMFAVAPAVLAVALTRVLQTLPGFTVPEAQLGAVLRLPGFAGTMSPSWLLATLAAGVAVALGLIRWGAARRPAPTPAPLWACGAAHLTSRMQYTATSFAQPLQRVFDDVLRPDIDVEVGHHCESKYLVQRMGYRARMSDAVERHLYRPLIGGVQTWAGWVRRAHNGSVHTYLLYGGLGLLLVLLVVR